MHQKTGLPFSFIPQKTFTSTVGRLFSFGFEPFDERSDGFFYASWSPSEDHQFIGPHQAGVQEEGGEINAWFDVFYFQRMALTE